MTTTLVFSNVHIVFIELFEISMEIFVEFG